MTTADQLETAQNEILKGALDAQNAIYVLAPGGNICLQIGKMRYDDDLRQRLVFLAALEKLESKLLVSTSNEKMYELTYSGWKEACTLAGRPLEYPVDYLKTAQLSLFVGALDANNEIHVVAASANTYVSCNNYSYDDSEEQRLIYLDALYSMERNGQAKFRGGNLYELSFSGLLYALDLKEGGTTQEKPNP